MEPRRDDGDDQLYGVSITGDPYTRNGAPS